MTSHQAWCLQSSFHHGERDRGREQQRDMVPTKKRIKPGLRIISRKELFVRLQEHGIDYQQIRNLLNILDNYIAKETISLVLKSHFAMWAQNQTLGPQICTGRKKLRRTNSWTNSPIPKLGLNYKGKRTKKNIQRDRIRSHREQWMRELIPDSRLRDQQRNLPYCPGRGASQCLPGRFPHCCGPATAEPLSHYSPPLFMGVFSHLSCSCSTFIHCAHVYICMCVYMHAYLCVCVCLGGQITCLYSL